MSTSPTPDRSGSPGNPGAPGPQSGAPGSQPGAPGSQSGASESRPGIPGPDPGSPESRPGVRGLAPGTSGSHPAPYHPGEVAPATPRPKPNRSAAEIRRDIESQRQQLGTSVEHLRDRVTELTDWRGQIRKHRKELVIGAAATGFVLGGLAALRRRR